MNGIEVHRSYIFVSENKGVVSRLMNYFSFVFSSLYFGVFKLKKYDFILCESPPLFLGISAWLLCKFKGAKLIFNVSDLWPESAEKLGIVTNKLFLNLATRLEEFLYRKSALITGQTQGIVSNIKNRFPTKKVYWLPNGVDLSFYNHQTTTTHWREENGFLSTDFILLYAGIIGHAQGIEVILKAAMLLKNYQNIKFIIVGSGPEKDKLLALKSDWELINVLFFDTVSKAQMPAIVQASNVSIIPLKRLNIFKGAIPSKIFENIAMKKPILLGVEGEAKELFIDDGKCGLAFEPENADELAKRVLALHDDQELLRQLGENGYDYVLKNFTRDKIAKEFYGFLIEYENATN
jgi:glycosyltransferase involved in cell wall biosynthesis